MAPGGPSEKEGRASELRGVPPNLLCVNQMPDARYQIPDDDMIKKPKGQVISTLKKKTLKISFIGNSEDIVTALDLAKEILEYSCSPDVMINALADKGVTAKLVGKSNDEFLFDVTSELAAE